MPKYGKRHYKGKRRASKFGKYQPNRFVQSYGGNLQNASFKSHAMFNIVSDQLTVDFPSAPANSDTSQCINYTFSVNALDSSQAVNIPRDWQQYRIRKAEVSVRPQEVLPFLSTNQILIKEFFVAPFREPGLASTLNYDSAKTLAGSQVRAPEFLQVGQRSSTSRDEIGGSRCVINSYLSKPVVGVLTRTVGSSVDDLQTVCHSSPWLSTNNDGLDAPHTGFAIGATYNSNVALTGSHTLFTIVTKLTIECRYPKLGDLQNPIVDKELLAVKRVLKGLKPNEKAKYFKAIEDLKATQETEMSETSPQDRLSEEQKKIWAERSDLVTELMS